jgi:hypothetical protein
MPVLPAFGAMLRAPLFIGTYRGELDVFLTVESRDT